MKLQSVAEARNLTKSLAECQLRARGALRLQGWLVLLFLMRLFLVTVVTCMFTDVCFCFSRVALVMVLCWIPPRA